jgi:hypothetical protein
MTTRAKDPTVAMRCPSPLVLFGIDSRGKTKEMQGDKIYFDGGGQGGKVKGNIQYIDSKGMFGFACLNS